MTTKRTLRTYDHRLIRLVQEAGDATIATDLGVPRSTVAGCVWAQELWAIPSKRLIHGGSTGSSYLGGLPAGSVQSNDAPCPGGVVRPLWIGAVIDAFSRRVDVYEHQVPPARHVAWPTFSWRSVGQYLRALGTSS